jgi:hypothetical protein
MNKIDSEDVWASLDSEIRDFGLDIVHICHPKEEAYRGKEGDAVVGQTMYLWAAGGM